MSSLNAYADSLDETGQPVDVDIPALFGDDVVPGEVPNTEPEIALITESVAAFEDMSEILNGLLKTGGMSRGVAMEARDIFPEFDKGKSLNAYSEVPSATRYKVAQESIIQGIRGFIEKAIEALKKMISKLITWFSGTAASEKRSADKIINDIGDKTEARLKGVDKAEKAAEDLYQSTQLVNDKVKSGLEFKFPNGEVKKFTSLEELIKAAYANTQAEKEIERFLLNFDPIYYDMLFDGPYSRGIAALSNAIRRAQSLMDNKISILKEVIRKGDKSQGAMQDFIDKRVLDSINKPLEVTFHGKSREIREAARLVTISRAMAEKVEVTAPISLAVVFERFSQLYAKGPIRQILRDYEVATVLMVNLQETVDKLQEISSDILVEDAVKSERGDINAAIRDIIPMIQHDLVSIATTMREIDTYRVDMENLNRNANTFSLLIGKRLRMMSIHSTHDDRASDWLKALNGFSNKHITDNIQSWQEAFTANFNVNGI